MEIQIAPGTCRVCGVSNAVGATHCCPACNTPHHQECWQYAGRCSTYGCGYSDVPVVVGTALNVNWPTIQWTREQACTIIIRIPLWAFYFTTLLGVVQLGALVVINGVQSYMMAMFSLLVILAALMAVVSIPISMIVYVAFAVVERYARRDMDSGIIDLHQLERDGGNLPE